jgi:hypothetical protein
VNVTPQQCQPIEWDLSSTFNALNRTFPIPYGPSPNITGTYTTFVVPTTGFYKHCVNIGYANYQAQQTWQGNARLYNITQDLVSDLSFAGSFFAASANTGYVFAEHSQGDELTIIAGTIPSQANNAGLPFFGIENRSIVDVQPGAQWIIELVDNYGVPPNGRGNPPFN